MSDEKVLTKEIVEQFLADKDSVDLNEFTTIDDYTGRPQLLLPFGEPIRKLL